MLKKMNYTKQTKLFGYLYISPFVIGFIIFFLYPLISVLNWSFFEIQPANSGGLDKTFVGWENYVFLFNDRLGSAKIFIRALTETVSSVLVDTPLIVFFSLFLALLVNLKYKGQGFVRVIFFLPIILGLDVVLQMLEATSLVGSELDGITAEVGKGGLFDLSKAYTVLMDSGLPEGISEFIVESVSKVFVTISKSGVQILIFLAALQSINSSLYEVAEIEGCSGYEKFWKITLPMISPMVLFVTIYTLIDLFLASSITTDIYNAAFGTAGKIGIGSAMSVLFMIAVIVIVALIGFIISKKVYKNE